MEIKINSVNPTFGIIELKPKDKLKSEELMSYIVNHSTFDSEREKTSISLYRLFEPYIRNEAELRARKRYPSEDVISDIKVRFWEFLYKIKPKHTIDDLIKQINEYKPFTSCLKPYREDRNLDEVILGTNELHYIDRVTEENLPIPQSEIELEKIKQTLKKTVQKTNMTRKTKKRVQKNAKGLSYKEIAKQEGVVLQTVGYSIKRGILQMQSKTGTISKENKQRISNVAKALGISFEKALSIALKYVEILSLNFETLTKNIESSARLLGISRKDFVEIGLKQPTLFGFKPETLNNNVINSSQLLGISRKDFIRASLKYPQLFYYKPETINNKVESTSKILGLSKSDFLRITLKDPSLLYMKPETLNKNIETSSKMLGLSKSDFINAGLRAPQLFYQKPETLNGNVETLIKLTGMAKSDYVKSVLKFPSLFHYKPTTLNKNIEVSSRLLGLSKKDFINLALKSPQLFYLKPETINKNIETSSILLKCSKKELLAEAVIHPQIFYLKPEGLHKKSKLMHYLKRLKKEKGDIRLSSLTHKGETQLYREILAYLIYKQKVFDKLSKSQIEKELSELLKSCQKDITLTIPKGEVVESFINFVQEYSLKLLGKNIFKFIEK